LGFSIASSFFRLIFPDDSGRSCSKNGTRSAVNLKEGIVVEECNFTSSVADADEGAISGVVLVQGGGVDI
jgi:hypothetical protein